LQCGDGAEPPVEARSDTNVLSGGGQKHEDEGLPPELLEDEAMGGEDEGEAPRTTTTVRTSSRRSRECSGTSSTAATAKATRTAA
jgi:hypothetical protein